MSSKDAARKVRRTTDALCKTLTIFAVVLSACSTPPRLCKELGEDACSGFSSSDKKKKTQQEKQSGSRMRTCTQGNQRRLQRQTKEDLSPSLKRRLRSLGEIRYTLLQTDALCLRVFAISDIHVFIAIFAIWGIDFCMHA